MKHSIPIRPAANKTDAVRIRVDPTTHQLATCAAGLEGIPVSELARRGLKSETDRVLKKYERRSNDGD